MLKLLVCTCALIIIFIAGMFCEKILPTRFEQTAVQWLDRNRARKREADAAARLIQVRIYSPSVDCLCALI